MDEIRLINILSSPSANVKQAGITDSNSTNLPPLIPNVKPGSVLSGFIINRDANGNPVLRTAENGDISFQTRLFLKIGAEVAIKVENRAGNTTARILTIDGQPPQQAQPVSVLTPDSASGKTPPVAQMPAAPVATSGNAAATPAATVSGSASIPATVTSAPPGNPLPQGAQLSVTISNITPPAGQTAGNAAPPAGAPQTQPNPAAINASDKAHYAAYKSTAPSASGNVASQTAQTTPITITPQTVQATVTANTAGSTTVQIAGGTTITLQTAQPIAPGSTLTVNINPANTQQAQAPLPPLPPIATLTQKWPSLTTLLNTLAGELSADAISNNANFSLLYGIAQGSSAPPPTPQAISSGLILFILALKQNDFRGFIGRDNTRLLEARGKQSLLQSAEADFLALARQFNDTPPGQWQSIFFPLAAHGEVQQLRLFLKRDGKKKSGDESAKDEDTRFIIEADLSKLGELQLDGFTRKTDKQLEFDLYIRTRSQLDEQTQKDIFAIYNNFGKLTGYQGQLAFQTVEEFPIHPLGDIIDEDDVGDIIA